MPIILLPTKRKKVARMRLIDADAFKKVLSEHEMRHDKRRNFDDYDCGAANAYEYAGDLLDEMPTVERQHGEWIKGREISRTMLCDETLCIDYENFTCSVCGLVLDRLLYNVDGSVFYQFCPSCGSPMTEKALEILRKREGDEK